MNIMENDMRVYNCRFEADIVMASTNVRFPCMYFVQWKSHNNKVEAVSQNISPVGNQAMFRETMALQTLMIYCLHNCNFISKHTTLVLNLLSKSKPTQPKFVGRLQIDLAKILNQHIYFNPTAIPLDFCTVDAVLTISLRATNKIEANIKVSQLERSAFHDIYGIYNGFQEKKLQDCNNSNPKEKETSHKQYLSSKNECALPKKSHIRPMPYKLEPITQDCVEVGLDFGPTLRQNITLKAAQRNLNKYTLDPDSKNKAQGYNNSLQTSENWVQKKASGLRGNQKIRDIYTKELNQQMKQYPDQRINCKPKEQGKISKKKVNGQQDTMLGSYRQEVHTSGNPLLQLRKNRQVNHPKSSQFQQKQEDLLWQDHLQPQQNEQMIWEDQCSKEKEQTLSKQVQKNMSEGVQKQISSLRQNGNSKGTQEHIATPFIEKNQLQRKISQKSNAECWEGQIKLLSENRQQKQLIQTIQKQKRDLQKEVERLQCIYNKVRIEAQQLKESNSSLLANQRRHKDQLQFQQNKNKALLLQQTELQNKKSMLENQLLEAKKTIENNSLRMQRQLQKAEDQCNLLLIADHDLKAQIGNLQQTVKVLTQEREELKAQRNCDQMQISQNIQRKAEQKVAKLLQEVEILKSQISALSEQNVELINLHNQVRNEIQGHKETILNLKANLVKKQTDVTKLSDNLQSFKDANTSLRKEIHQLHQKIQNAQQENSDQSHMILELQGSIQNVEQRSEQGILELKKMIADKDIELEKKEERLQYMNHQLNEALSKNTQIGQLLTQNKPEDQRKLVETYQELATAKDVISVLQAQIQQQRQFVKGREVIVSNLYTQNNMLKNQLQMAYKDLNKIKVQLIQSNQERQDSHESRRKDQLIVKCQETILALQGEITIIKNNYQEQASKLTDKVACLEASLEAQDFSRRTLEEQRSKMKIKQVNFQEIRGAKSRGCTQVTESSGLDDQEAEQWKSSHIKLESKISREQYDKAVAKLEKAIQQRDQMADIGKRQLDLMNQQNNELRQEIKTLLSGHSSDITQEKTRNLLKCQSYQTPFSVQLQHQNSKHQKVGLAIQFTDLQQKAAELRKEMVATLEKEILTLKQEVENLESDAAVLREEVKALQQIKFNQQSDIYQKQIECLDLKQQNIQLQRQIQRLWQNIRPQQEKKLQLNKGQEGYQAEGYQILNKNRENELLQNQSCIEILNQSQGKALKHKMQFNTMKPSSLQKFCQEIKMLLEKRDNLCGLRQFLERQSHSSKEANQLQQKAQELSTQFMKVKSKLIKSQNGVESVKIMQLFKKWEIILHELIVLTESLNETL